MKFDRDTRDAIAGSVFALVLLVIFGEFTFILTRSNVRDSASLAERAIIKTDVAKLQKRSMKTDVDVESILKRMDALEKGRAK